LYGVHRTRRDGSSFEWHQPCKNQTALQAHHLGGHSERAVKSYSHSFRATCDKSAVQSAISKRPQWSVRYCMAGSSCRCSARVPAGFACSNGDRGCCHRATGLRAGHIPPALPYGASIVTQGAQPFTALSGWMDAKFKCSFSCK